MYNEKLKNLVLLSYAYPKKRFGGFLSRKSSKPLTQLLIQETSFLLNAFSNRERLYYVEHDLHTMVLCENCNIQKSTWDWKKSEYKKLCSSCQKKSIETTSKRKTTCQKKYGVSNVSQNADIHNKKLQTKLKNFNNENFNNRDKFEKTCRTKYNGIGIGSTYIKSKIDKTNTARYGYDNPFKNKNIQQQCQESGRINYHKRFKIESNKIHNNFYGYPELKGSHDLIRIVCQVHGDFYQQMYVHMRGSGCPTCAKCNPSKPSIEWLEYKMETEGIYIQHGNNGGEYRIPGTLYDADGYCAETNTIYEFHGNYWHGNLRIYDPNDIHPTRNITYGEIYEATISRENHIRSLGYNLVVIWEDEFTQLLRN